MKMHSNMKGIVMLFGLSTLLNGCGAIADLHAQQGWDDSDRNAWYLATQGSRLIPEKWFTALEEANGDKAFATMENLTSYGFLAPPATYDNGLPIGFAKDKQDDANLGFSNLKWYAGQKSTDAAAETWIGLNCAACHSAKISYRGSEMIVDGGPNLLDFQLFIEELDAAMNATVADDAKWNRFAAAVLEGKDSADNRSMLLGEFERLLAWQRRTDAMNETPIRYGFGRLDAVGHILNKILMFNGAEASQGNPANAPVSYPFLWNIWKQERVQWNGVARNSRFQFAGDAFEYGALGRNTGEVLGVFGDIVITPQSGVFDRLGGYVSSVQSENLAGLELVLQDLEPPTWPEIFPPIDTELSAEGEALFATECAHCHKDQNTPASDDGNEVMVTFETTLETAPGDLTDIWMACNAYVYQGPSGPMAGTRDLGGEVIGQVAPVADMLAVAVQGALLGDKTSLVKEGFRNFFGIRRTPQVFESAREDNRAECLNTKSEPLLAYKARPLDGIWATAPYLHNGSVASLYELLLPAEERMTSFWVGSREYDPENVGYLSMKPADSSEGFLLRTRDASGNVIEGNSNAGHEYGADRFTDRQRRAIVEYLKGL
ncbi:ribonuclease E and G [Citreicella sp. SE45]|nr:ribonuclease E and G [Citreicella sp. SE45]